MQDHARSRETEVMKAEQAAILDRTLPKVCHLGCIERRHNATNRCNFESGASCWIGRRTGDGNREVQLAANSPKTGLSKVRNQEVNMVWRGSVWYRSDSR